ncbi:MAG TPA: NADH-quinone oxidoreductase subunit M, partial [Gemmatimonadaceae bacterium]
MRDLLTSINYNGWVLPALLIIPLVGALVLLVQAALTHDEGSLDAAPTARWVALITFLIELVVSLGLWWSFDPGSSAWQARVSTGWIPQWGARFDVGVDGISLFMVLLTTLLMPLSVLGSWTAIKTKVRSYYALMLILTTGMIGVFLALDLLLFYLMWEIMLIPMYFIIGVWGGDRRIYASLKFFIYTMLGSLLMLVGIIYLWMHSGDPFTGQLSFSYDHILQNAAVTSRATLWLFGAFFLAFAIKVPMFPFHTWLPDA